jgi:hypothetical protein
MKIIDISVIICQSFPGMLPTESFTPSFCMTALFNLNYSNCKPTKPQLDFHVNTASFVLKLLSLKSALDKADASHTESKAIISFGLPNRPVCLFVR